MDTVWIKHPKLPGSPPVQQPVSALPELQRSGWEQADPPPPEPDPGRDGETYQPTSNQEDPATAGSSALPDQSPRRRRASSKESE